MTSVVSNQHISRQEILNNLRHIKTRIQRACFKVGRDPKSVQLLLATKTVPVEKIRIVLDQRVFDNLIIGENKIREALAKYQELSNYYPQWHMIGHLQSNKIKHALKFAHCIQSVDRMRLAQKLQQRCVFENRTINIFIQVNTSKEKSKFGVGPKEALAFIKEVAKMDRLRIKGLMTIGLLSNYQEATRPCFRLLKNLQKQAQDLRLPNADFTELSMGMSGDLEVAIEEGATMIRVGTAIFGKRKYPDAYYWNENS